MTVEMKTTISDVTVFRDGARVTRAGKAKVDAGENTIIVGGITQYAHDDSFRVKGKGAAILKGIDVKKTTKTYEPEEDQSVLLADLKKLEFESNKISDNIQYQESRVIHFNSIASQFSSEFGKWYAAGESTAKHLSEMDNSILKLLGGAKEKIRKLRLEHADVQTRIQVLRNNLGKIQGRRKTETHAEVIVLLDAKQATEIELEVTYQLGAAGWIPTYDVDLGKESATLKRIGMVNNNTLEDWADVSLVVSTASARPVEAVEPSPFYIDEYQAYMESSYGMLAASTARDEDGLDDLVGGAMDMEYAKEEAEEAFEPAPEIIHRYAESSETLSGTVIYSVPGKVTVPYDTEPHPITLTEEEFESRKLYFWNAYAMPEVVAQDEITNAESVILPGKVKVYSEGEFIGETNVNLIAPRETFRLGTRTAYDVKAEKKLVLKDTDKAGFTRGKKKRGYTYQLIMESFSKDDIEMRVVDRIPHSTSEKIVVEFEPPKVPVKKMELGVIEWEISITAQEKSVIEYEFDIEWEKDITISPSLP
ncbi:MAG: mucoidy inhibitor MuiA family protein [Candidatus Thorarchaeota archaeon]